MARKVERATTESSREAAPQSVEEMLNEYYSLEAQLKTLTEQARTSESALLEYAVAHETLKEMEKLADDSEILVPLGRDNFARAKLIDTKNVLVSIGSDVVVKKSAVESAKLAESRIKSYEQSLNALNTMASSIEQRLSTLGPKIQALAQKSDKK